MSLSKLIIYVWLRGCFPQGKIVVSKQEEIVGGNRRNPGSSGKDYYGRQQLANVVLPDGLPGPWCLPTEKVDKKLNGEKN